MRAVLYTHNMEPITVLTLNKFVLECLQKFGRVLLQVHEPFDNNLFDVGATPAQFQIRSVVITSERLMRNGREHMILFTEQEESALLLRASFLAGQTRQLNDEKDMAFAQGFLRALDAFGRNI